MGYQLLFIARIHHRLTIGVLRKPGDVVFRALETDEILVTQERSPPASAILIRPTFVALPALALPLLTALLAILGSLLALVALVL